MKKIIFTFEILTLLITSTFSQTLHSPAEIFSIMDKSIIMYEIGTINLNIVAPNRNDKLNYNDYYRVKNDSGIFTYKYKSNQEADKLLKIAEDNYQNGKISEAREMYMNVLKLDASYYQVMTYIGQMYGIEKNLDKAIEWYTKTIQLNYIDYLAHWLLADIYKMKGEIEKAVEEITIAQILNRNNPRLNKALVDIYELKNLEYSNWSFTPQYTIDSVSPRKVKIESNPDWLGHALVKAVWLYEPGYKEKMGYVNGNISILQEKECLLSLIAGFDKKKIKKYSEFKALQLALNDKRIDEYIFYEIILPDYPFVAYQLNEDFINNLKDYVIKTRTKVN